MMKATIEVPVYEVGGDENKVLDELNRRHLTIESHWNRRALVVLKDSCHQPITVYADDLIRAIKAAQYAHRF